MTLSTKAQNHRFKAVVLSEFHIFTVKIKWEEYVKWKFHLKLNIPGNSQSPVGILALISTFPYLNENESCVRILALRIGLIIIGTEPVRSHPKNDGFVHLKKLNFISLIYLTSGTNSRFVQIRKNSRVRCFIHTVQHHRKHGDPQCRCLKTLHQTYQLLALVECADNPLHKMSLTGYLCTTETPSSVNAQKIVEIE